jgi:hypothetical protein
MKVKYGYTAEGFVHLSDSADIETAVKMAAKALKIKKFDCDYKFVENDESRYVEVWFQPSDIDYACVFYVSEETLLEIDGHLHPLPRWCYDSVPRPVEQRDSFR